MCRRSTKGVVPCKSQVVVANDAVGELSKVRRAYATVSAAKQFVHEGRHDWHHDHAGKTFLTDVDVRRGLPSAAYHALTEDLKPTKGVRRLGPDEYVVTAEYKQMPSYIALPLINDAILRSAPFCTDPREQRFWWAHIASDDFQRMLCDAFYFTIANVVQIEAAQRNLAGITSLEGSAQFQRIACNYVSMLKRIPKERKRSFEDHFDEVLSYAILLCLHAGFPNQLDKLKTPEFCQRVLDMCTEWLRGLRPSRNGRDRVRGAWMRRSLFGASSRGRIGKLLEAQEGLSSGRAADTSRERYVGQSTRRLKYTLHHSPVVEQYLLLNEGRVGMPHLAARLTLTEDPSASMRNMGLTAEEVETLRGRIVTGKRRYVPDVPTLLKCARREQQRLQDEHVQQVEAHRKSILDVRQGKFEYTSSKPVTQELEALISAKDTHEISNYVLTKFTRLARYKAAKVLK